MATELLIGTTVALALDPALLLVVWRAL